MKELGCVGHLGPHEWAICLSGCEEAHALLLPTSFPFWCHILVFGLKFHRCYFSRLLGCSFGISIILKNHWLICPTLPPSQMSGLWKIKSCLSKPLVFMGKLFIEFNKWWVDEMLNPHPPQQHTWGIGMSSASMSSLIFNEAHFRNSSSLLIVGGREASDYSSEAVPRTSQFEGWNSAPAPPATPGSPVGTPLQLSPIERIFDGYLN